MAHLALVAGLLLLFIVLSDTFETIVLPRGVTRRLRLTRFFYFTLFKFYNGTLRRVLPARGRESVLNAFGPLSLLLLLAFWAVGLIFSFALIQWGLGTRVLDAGVLTRPGLSVQLYISGSTFFTLGYGDLTPATPIGRSIAVIEAGMGLGFLAVVIGYLPVIYQSFSRREAGISLLDARAGSPPTAAELIRRHAQAGCMETLIPLLRTLEAWSADMLESHLSYPVLAYYRSQHDRESWLAALTAILDTCALISMRFEGDPAWESELVWQAHLTFAMARHTVVDLALVFNITPAEAHEERLPASDMARLREQLSAAGAPLHSQSSDARLADLRLQYEPYVCGLAKRLKQTLPPFVQEVNAPDNWQSTAWDNQHF